MTEKQLIEIGFKLEESYTHDEFNTNRFSKGVLEVEFTYCKDKLLTHEVTIKEINSMPTDLDEIKALDAIFDGWDG